MSCKILIVDDSAVVRHSLRSCIEGNPTITVCGEAENGQVAIDKVKELKPDVVILDWQMPVMNGLEAARHIARFVPSRLWFCLHSTAATNLPSKLGLSVSNVSSQSPRASHTWLPG